MTTRVRVWSVPALVLATVLWAAPAQARSPRVPGPPPQSPTASLALPKVAVVTGHLLDIAASSKPVSAWASTDLTAIESAASVIGAVSTAVTGTGVVLVAGRTTADHVVLFSSSASGRTWTAGDLTVRAKAPLAAGSPSVVVSAGVVRVFYRTTAGDLFEVENDRKNADPWFASSLTALTASTDGARLTGDPSAVAPTGYPIAVYARATTGDLVSFTLTSTHAHPWYYVDITALSHGPQLTGTPTAVPAPDGFGLTAVYARTTTGHLVEFTDDDVGYHLWSVRDVSVALGLPAVSASPTALAGMPTEVATVTATGHVVVASIPSVSLVGATYADVSALVRQRVAPGRTVSIAPSKAGYVVAGVTAANHVVVFSVPSPSTTPQNAASVSAASAPPAPSVADVTMQPLTEQFARSDPTAVDVHGVVHVYVSSGGFLGLIARIVLTAASQDQFHARIEDTPTGSDCNPFTASFGRGSTSGCATGTAAEQWCSDFAQWVWQTSGINTSGISGAAKTFVTWGRSHGRFLQGINQKPAVGDAVVWGVLNPLWGAHVGIVVGVRGRLIDVVSGNSGPLAVASAVWDSGYFLPSSQAAQGDPIIGYTSPVALPASAKSTPSAWPRTAAWPVVQGTGSVTVAGS
jgi:hypothetical protein